MQTASTEAMLGIAMKHSLRFIELPLFKSCLGEMQTCDLNPCKMPNFLLCPLGTSVTQYHRPGKFVIEIDWLSVLEMGKNKQASMHSGQFLSETRRKEQ